jgi:hypothetical protein
MDQTFTFLQPFTGFLGLRNVPGRHISEYSLNEDQTSQLLCAFLFRLPYLPIT